MASDDTRYPILVDTDALIAFVNSSLWNRLTEHVGLTTTNVCKLELDTTLSEETASLNPQRATDFTV